MQILLSKCLLFWLAGTTLLLSQQTDTERLHRLFREAREQQLEDSPELATYRGDTRFNDRWTDFTPSAIEHRKQRRKARWATLTAIDRSRLTAQDQLNYDLFATTLREAIERDGFPGYLLAMDPLFNGPHISVPAVLAGMPARTANDCENYLARLRAVPKLLEQSIALLEEGRRTGVTQPRSVMREVPAQLERLTAGSPENSPFLAALQRLPASMPESERALLRREAAKVVDGEVFPAFRRLRTYLQKRYLPACRDSIARAGLPNGKQWYAVDVRQHTTTTTPVSEIHDMGMREVKRIRAAMEGVMHDVRFTGSFAAFVEFLRTDPRFYYTNTADLLAGYRDLCKRIEPELPRLFLKLPRLPYGVEPVAAHIAPSETTARYRAGSEDGRRAGAFLANTYKLETRPKFEMEALTLHEAVPGHHLQIALAQEMEGVPEFRRSLRFNAYGEGWGLYAESLGEELGFYKDPYSKFGQLSYEMWRACRLVVDTGMHELGWSRQQAIDFMKQNTALTEQNIVVEVDRYIAWPGQALAYKMGELRIKQLRQEAERELGAKFDIRQFHHAVLRNGPLPLDILSREVRAWIRAQAAH
ncbi:MAG: DUF885 domain-containing protein [Bryobacterales bacterium]|nr:DUF885 domain-containing protein [Bryobacterales bacterium]